MAGDSAVIVKTRKFKKNPLLARKQVRRVIIIVVPLRTNSMEQIIFMLDINVRT